MKTNWEESKTLYKNDPWWEVRCQLTTTHQVIPPVKEAVVDLVGSLLWEEIDEY